MNFKIKNIILYPINWDLKPRIITFDPKKVNVITGYSKRGKSSIIEIIDYCLGNSECDIPIGKIRELVEVFALKISIDDQDYFIARDSPKRDLKSSENMYLISLDKKGEYPMLYSNEWINHKEQFKENRDSIKEFLDTKAKFPNIYERNERTEKEIKIGFRYTTAFQFQTQSIIANGNIIFYNTDDLSYLEGLKKMFPIALAYKSFKMITLEDEVKDLKKEIATKESKIEDLEKRYENWVNDLFEFYTEAINLSLTNRNLDINLSNTDEIKIVLEEIIQDVNNNVLYKSGTAFKYNQKLNEFEDKRQSLLRELQIKKIELNKITKFETLKKEYTENIYREVSKRLSPIDWFLEQKGTEICPFCDSKSNKALTNLQSLKEKNIENSKILNDQNFNDLTFEKEKRELNKEVKRIEKEIGIFDINIENLLKEMNDNHFEYQKIYQFVGKISNFLKNLNIPDTKYFEELLILKNDLLIKEQNLSKETKKYNKSNTLLKVTNSIKKYIELLPIENNTNSNVLIDPDKYLGIKIENRITGNSTFLNKIGSGSNYMCYHLATMLGLHNYFYNLKNENKTNYIPSFLILDQPSQVYYPDKTDEIDEIEQKEKDNELSKNESEDIQNTKKIFEVCSKFMKNTNNDVQVIILEHAGKNNWNDLPNINLVETWRGSDKDGYSADFNALIQKDWLTD
nr:DUF3732 domain-containing protein [uncultured Flavobacterium sp.]